MSARDLNRIPSTGLAFTSVVAPHASDAGMLSPRAAGVLRLVDPKIATASFIPFLVGVALARHDGGFLSLEIVVGGLLALLAIETSKNAVNDLYDFRSGADLGLREDERTPFSGGKRVLVDGLLTEEETAHVAVLALLAAIALGGLVALIARPSLLGLGAVGAFVAIAYTAPPFRLCYRGLGEAAVFAMYGPGIVLGTVLLFRPQVPSTALWAAGTLGLLVANVLLVNELPDARADAAAGKRTLVVRLGTKRSIRLVAAVFVVALALPFMGIATGETWRLAAVAAGIPFAVGAVLRLRGAEARPFPVPAQIATLLTFVVAGLALFVALMA